MSGWWGEDWNYCSTIHFQPQARQHRGTESAESQDWDCYRRPSYYGTTSQDWNRRSLSRSLSFKPRHPETLPLNVCVPGVDFLFAGALGVHARRQAHTHKAVVSAYSWTRPLRSRTLHDIPGPFRRPATTHGCLAPPQPSPLAPGGMAAKGKNNPAI